jgi:hypothetical protein
MNVRALTLAAVVGLALTGCAAGGNPVIAPTPITVQQDTIAPPTTRLAPAPPTPPPHVTSAAADTAVVTMHDDLAYVIALYEAAGVSLSPSENAAIADALVTTSDAATVVVGYINADAYSVDQLLAIGNMATAGKAVSTAIGDGVSDSTIERLWQPFQDAYDEYQAAS